jgi:DNA-binding HxlR family transcriptional regulator
MGKIKILENDLDIKNCPVRKVLDRFGDKWSLLVLLILGKKETLRFNEINKAIGSDISQKMLTTTLRTLEADGFLKRTIYPEIPPRVEYTITDLGKSLVPLIDKLEKWAKGNMSAIEKSRKFFEQVKS